MNWPRTYRYKSGDTLTHQHLNPAIYTILIRYISLTKQKRHLGNNWKKTMSMETLGSLRTFFTFIHFDMTAARLFDYVLILFS